MDVSVIVPIYHGIKYIDQMIKQVERAAEETDGKVELLFVNDDPKEPIPDSLFSDKIVIRIYNSECNRGIHGARVKGLSLSAGTYIVFLDQDDKISPSYLKSQIKQLKDADAVVCQMADDNKVFYNENRQLKDCICKETMTQTGNFIVSPGQVLLKREAVPSFWTSNLLSYNGADDWFLWICMMCEGRVFQANEELLFWHMKHEANASSDSLSMLSSISEVYEKLTANPHCAGRELEGIHKIVKDHAVRFIKERDKFLDMYVLADRWMTLLERGIAVSEYFIREGLSCAAIYGRGRFGVRIAKELMENGIDICYFIDKSKETSSDGIAVTAPWELKEIKEPVIITLVKEGAEEVFCMLKEKGAEQIYFIEDVIKKLEKEEREKKIE